MVSTKVCGTLGEGSNPSCLPINTMDQGIFIIKPFHFDSLKMKKLRKNSRHSTIQKNNEIYIEWMLQTLKSIYTLPKDKTYNALCIYMNPDNIEKLHNYLSPMVWLNYSPKECLELSLDQVAIDMTSIVENKL